jgi:hypothetical protein
VQISTASGTQKEVSPVLPRNKYTEIHKPTSKYDAKRPEFKVCKYTAEAIITEGSGIGTVQKVCANLTCPVHHPKQKASRGDEKWKAEQEKQRKEQPIANAGGLRVLAAVSAAVRVRLMKRDLLFILEKLVALMDERRLALDRGEQVCHDSSKDLATCDWRSAASFSRSIPAVRKLSRTSRPSFSLPSKSGRKNPLCFSLHPRPAASLRSPVARQGPSSSSCTFP